MSIRLFYVAAACCVLVFLAPCPVVLAEEKGTGSEREDTFKTVQKLIKEKDVYAAVQYVINLGDDKKVVNAFHFLVLDAHHKAKSPEQVIALGNAGIEYCMIRASQEKEKSEAKSAKLMIAAKIIATNIASFTWPGWNEKGMTLSEDQIRQGLYSARFSVRTAHQLKFDDGKLSFTYWFLGAQLMANRKYGEAIDAFTKAKGYAEKQKGNAEGVAMNNGYIGLAKILSGKKEEGERAYSQSITGLKKIGSEDALFFAEQLKDVRKVFEKRM